MVKDGNVDWQRWAQLAELLEGELRWDQRSIDSSSRVHPWKISFLRSSQLQTWQSGHSQLTVFGEPRSRRFAVHRDSLPKEVLRAGTSSKPPEGARKADRLSEYKLSQFLVDIAPRWADPAPRAAITLTDQGAADWVLVDHEHVAIGWERAYPTLAQLELGIRLLRRVTALPASTVPFR